MFKKSILTLIAVSSILFAASSLHAVVYPLEVFTNNGSFASSSDIVIYVDVLDAGSDQVDFVFYNNSLVSSSVAQIYFDDGSLLGIAGIVDGLGTDFEQEATPNNLPSGNTLTPSFEATEGFSIGASSPPPQKGINPGESVKITFDLVGGQSFADVIGQLNTGDLRIGAHLIALPDGSSESMVNVPEPTTVALLGLGALTLLRKRSAK